MGGWLRGVKSHGVSTRVFGQDYRIHKIKGFRLRHADNPESSNEILFILLIL